MPQYSVGQAIRGFRERKGIIQSVLCEGICSVATLSKIENGQQNPSATVMEALLERLGQPIGLYNVPVTEVRYKRAILEQKIIDIVAELGSNIESLLDEYANFSEPMDKFEKQFYLYMMGIQKYLNGENPEQVLIYYLKALKITFLKYDLLFILRRIFNSVVVEAPEILLEHFLDGHQVSECQAGFIQLAVGNLG